MDELKQNLFAQHNFESLIFENKFRTGAIARIVQDLRSDDIESANQLLDLLRESEEAEGDLWYHIVGAFTRYKAGRMLEAKTEMRRVAEMQSVESLITLWAWNTLRAWGQAPDDDVAQKVLGIVMEVGLDNGMDVMAAYEDGTSRYVSRKGSMIIWDDHDDHNNDLARQIVAAAQAIVDQLPASTAEAVTSTGKVQFSVLTVGGIRGIIAPMNELSRAASPLSPLFNASKELLISLIKTVEESKQK
jgi:hypothetical protein